MLGSFSRLGHTAVRPDILNRQFLTSLPLYTGENGSDIVCRAPSVLQYVEAKLSSAVDVGMKHGADELDSRWLVWVLFFKVHHKAECSIFEGCVCRANDDGVPSWLFNECLPSGSGRPYHVMTLSAMGDADTPAGGSVCIRYNMQALATGARRVV